MREKIFPESKKYKNTIELVKSDGKKYLITDGKLYMSWEINDDVSQRLAIVQLYQNGMMTQKNIAETFNIHINSVQKYISTFSNKGASSLLLQPKGPRNNWKLTSELKAKILLIFLKGEISEYESIQNKLEEWNERVSLASIRQVLLENGFVKERNNFNIDKSDQLLLFENHEEEENQLYIKFNCHSGVKEVLSEISKKGKEEIMDEEIVEFDESRENKARRYYSRVQRQYLDQLEEGTYSAYAGGFLLIPFIDKYSFIPAIKKIIEIPTYEGFSLEELCLTLFYFDIFRFSSLEDFKTVYPEEFGLLIGRMSGPGIYTLRRFLHKVRELESSEKLIEEFGYEYIKKGLANYGVIYIDGHFMPYYGMYSVSKGWHAVRKEPMKGSYNFIGVDEKFKPWIFLIRSSTEDLLEKIPEIINKAKEIGSRVGLSREEVDNLIVLFDREGYSAKLFRYLDGRDKDDKKRRAIFISWVKYSEKWVNDISESSFDKSTEIEYELQKKKSVKYFETVKTMNKYGKIRTVVIENEKNGKRMAICTNGKNEEIRIEKVVELICRRWGEENLIKELLNKHLIDYTPGYFLEELDEQPMTKNPAVRELKNTRSKKSGELQKLKVKLADKLLDVTDKTIKELKKSQIDLLSEIAQLNKEILLIDQQIDKLPGEIRYDKAHAGKKMVKMNYEKKRFLDCIKIFSYNLEKELSEILLKYYDNRKDVFSVFSMIVHRGGYVKLIDGKLFVQLRKFKNREVNYVTRHLCDELNEMMPITLDKYHFPLFFEVL